MGGYGASGIMAAAAAAKVAGIGVANGALRGNPVAARAVEHIVASSSVKSFPPVSAIVSSVAGVDHIDQRPLWETDDWEFPSDDDREVVFSSQLPRIISAGPPTIQEATSAIEDLNTALESYPDIKCIIKPRSTKGETDFQKVVTNIATDENVWEAIMSNPSLLEFIDSQYTGEEGEEEEEEGSEKGRKGEEDGGGGVMKLLKKVKDSVKEMWGRLTSEMGEFLGREMSPDGAVPRFILGPAATACVGAVLMVILIVVLKRN